MKTVLAIFLLIIIAAIVLPNVIRFNSEGPSQDRNQPQADPLANQRLRAAVDAVALKHSMRDPESFDLQSILSMDDGTLCFTFRANNGFGGKNIVYAASHNGSLKTREQPGGTRLWNRYCASKSGYELVVK